MMTLSTKIKNEYIIKLAQGILDDCRKQKIEIRLLGSVAIMFLDISKIDWLSENRKGISDIDLVVLASDINVFESYMLSKDFRINNNIKMLYGNIRRNYYSKENISVDVFIQDIYLCQRINISNRFGLSYPTIPVADMFLEKIQKQNLNTTDIFDIDYILNYLTDFDYIIHLCAIDWRWWKTLQTNISKILGSNINIKNKTILSDILKQINDTNKSTKWKLRSFLGSNIKWYNTVEN